MIEGVNHITLAFSNIEKSFEFYRTVLGLKPVVRWSSGAYLTAGETWIALHQDPEVTEAERSDYSHIAFSCPRSGFHKLKSRLLSNTIED